MRPAPPRTAPTYISPGIRIKGTIIADEDVYIDGDVQGSLSVPGHRLTVGELAYIDADTIAREVVVYGAHQGGLCAFERIEIKKHASVAGDVATAKIVIEDGANFKGVISADAAAYTKP
jgi:cytoskeletal protein CcmA (bactofilin family)